jgi:hypothetical protein
MLALNTAWQDDLCETLFAMLDVECLGGGSLAFIAYILA